MTFLARLHPFLILAVLIVAIFVTGLFWEAPFQGEPQGLPHLFSRAWEVAFLPVQMALEGLRAAGVGTTRIITTAVLACYAGLFVLLDIVVTKAARR